MDEAQILELLRAELGNQLTGALQAPEAQTALREIFTKTLTEQAGPLLEAQAEADRKGEAFQTAGEFTLAVRIACMPGGARDARLVQAPSLDADGRVASGQVDSNVGFLLPTPLLTMFLQKMMEQESVNTKCFPIPMTSNMVEIPFLDEISRVTGARYGGVRAYKHAEGAQKTPTDTKIAQLALKLHEASVLIPVTNSVLEDSPVSLEALLVGLGTRELNWILDEEIFWGTGASQANGFINANCAVSIAKETGQANNTINMDNIIKMWARMPAYCRNNAIWTINQDCEPQLYKLAMVIGTGGVPVYLPPGGLSEKPYGSIFGRPVFPTEHNQTVGVKGDIALADFTQYLLGSKVGSTIQIASSVHLWFDFNRTAFRLTMRWDGSPWWKESMLPAKGTNKLSPFINLAARTAD